MSGKASIAGTVVAGFPSPAEQYMEPPLDLNAWLVHRPAATYFVRVKGDSMEGAGIRANDLLIVDRSLEPANGCIVIAAVDGEFTVKIFRRDEETGKVSLEPANDKYPTLEFRDGQELRIFGVVTSCIHRFLKTAW